MTDLLVIVSLFGIVVMLTVLGALAIALVIEIGR